MRCYPTEATVGWLTAVVLSFANSVTATHLEAIVPNATLPPPAGTYEMWPPDSQVRFPGTFTYQGTNVAYQGSLVEGEIVLSEVKAGEFSNITRTVDGVDEMLEFHAMMSTRVPYFRVNDQADHDLALEGQDAGFKVRVHNRQGRTEGRFELTVESFSFALRSHDNKGVWSDAIQVRNRAVSSRSGWIEIAPLANGKWLMQSELDLWPEGRIVPLESPYFPADKPAHLELRGEARELRVLDVRAEDVKYRWIVLSDLGTNFTYGIDYSLGQSPLQWVPLQILQAQGSVLFCAPPAEAILFRGTAKKGR